MGGDYAATGEAAESEGLLVVEGDASFDKNPAGTFNVGTVGGGSQIAPAAGETMLAVGGDLSSTAQTTVQVGAGLQPGGAVHVGGSTTGALGELVTGGGEVTTGMGLDAALAPFDDFGDVVATTSTELAALPVTQAAPTRDETWEPLTFTGPGADADPASVIVFDVDASMLTGSLEIDFDDMPRWAPVVINVRGVPEDITFNVTQVLVDGVLADDFSSQDYGNVASTLLWNFVDATSLTMEGGSQFLGSIVAPQADATLFESTNGRVYVGGDLTVSGTGSEQHNFPWIGPAPFGCGAGGGFSLSKQISGDAADAVPTGTVFTVRWSAILPDGVEYSGATSGTVTVGADGSVVEGPDDLPAGTAVSFVETDLPEIAGVVCGTPVFDPASVTVADGEIAAVTLTNTADVPPEPAVSAGGFSVAKQISGDGAGLVPDGREFTVAWSAGVPDALTYGGATAGTLTLTADGPAVSGPQDLPEGTVVSLSEVTPGAVTGMAWGVPRFEIDGRDVTQLQIVGGTSVSVLLDNTASITPDPNPDPSPDPDPSPSPDPSPNPDPLLPSTGVNGIPPWLETSIPVLLGLGLALHVFGRRLRRR